MDVVMWLLLAAVLIPANIYAVKWHRSGRVPLWASGLFTAVLGIGLGFAAGLVLVGIGDSGQGGGFMAAFIGLVAVGNGLLLFLMGLVLVIGKQFNKKDTPV
ncbi:hypothetical protein [Halobacillus sp. BAB-2008]|uniref:hypothetical protein n=1 Tax=Halobacillus sp. BAB-2008 TaxID=1246484 RepID=UPI0002A51BEC|nr:hypothetical protein [Halobacillus sp. BAB-2008]ELK44282.1 inner-membrane translocator [Halobacillus sp. BAB-2008]